VPRLPLPTSRSQQLPGASGLLLGVVFDHVARLPGDCRCLRVRASRFEKEHHRRLSQIMKHEPPLTQGPISDRFNSSSHDALNPSRVQGLPRELVRIVPLIRPLCMCAPKDRDAKQHRSHQHSRRPPQAPREDVPEHWLTRRRAPPASFCRRQAHISRPRRRLDPTHSPALKSNLSVGGGLWQS
jgi:hypothetical protein